MHTYIQVITTVWDVQLATYGFWVCNPLNLAYVGSDDPTLNNLHELPYFCRMKKKMMLNFHWHHKYNGGAYAFMWVDNSSPFGQKSQSHNWQTDNGFFFFFFFFFGKFCFLVQNVFVKMHSFWNFGFNLKTKKLR